MSIDKELKELVDKAKEALGQQKQLQDAINEIRAWGEEKGRLAETEAALKALNEEQKKFAEDVQKRLDQVRRQVRSENGSYRGAFTSEEQAREFALVAVRNTCPEYRSKAIDILNKDHKDFVTRATGTAHDGEEFLVPREHSTRIQRLVEEYGLFPRLAYRMPMLSDTLTFHRRKSGLRGRKTKVRTAVTEQTAGWGPVNLTAEDFDILASYPRTLSEDVLVAIAELLVQEMALGFAIALDEDGLIGDGTATYDNETGLTFLLQQINGVDNGGGLVLASGSTGAKWTGITKDDVAACIGQARYVRAGQGRIICSNEFYWTVLVKHITAAGGITRSEFESGPRLQYFGVPVEISPVMPRSGGDSQICMLYGDVYQSSTLGDRMRMEIRSSSEVRFESKEVVVLGSARYALNNHTLGDATTAGPVVGLITPAAAG